MKRDLLSYLQSTLLGNIVCLTRAATSVLLAIILIPFYGFAQTGPGGVGTNDGTSNLKIWYRPDFGIATDGTNVDLWKNAAGIAAHNLAATGIKRPTLMQSELNGVNVLSFNETHYLGTMGVLSTGNFLTNQATCFLVVKSVDADNNAVYATVGNSGVPGATGFAARVSAEAGTVHFDAGGTSGNARISGTGLTGFDTYSQWVYTLGAAQKAIYRNGTLVTTKSETAVSYSSHSTEKFRIGTGLNGNIAEMIIYNRELNEAERIVVQNYLAAKYNLAIPDSKYDVYLEDDEIEGNYDYDVAGILKTSSTSMVTDAQGTGIVRISNPTGLGEEGDEGESFFWGHNGAPLNASETKDVPTAQGIASRLERVWRVSELTTNGVGATDMAWDLSGLGTVTASQLKLLVDSDEDGLFDDAPVTATAVDIGGGIFKFTAVPDESLSDRYRFTLGFTVANSQMTPSVINAYAAVTEINGAVLSLDHVYESQNTFEKGGRLIVMQMKDNVVTNLTNTLSYGDVADIQNAGVYEAVSILDVTKVSGVTTSVTISSLINTYHTGPNATLQIISFPYFTDYTTSSDLTAKPWDGFTGGIFAIEVANTFTVAHHISVDGLGFVGGDPNPTSFSAGCDAHTYFTSNQYGRKGEGIFKMSDANHMAGRGKIANGGGGGNDSDAGGGGGANFTHGGEGGFGGNGTAGGCTDKHSGGLPGADLSHYITSSRIFMGGGGGGGQQNNGKSKPGGNGGGIIIIRADTVKSGTECNIALITANGENGMGIEGESDGASGAGAGGSIMFDVRGWDLNCQLITQAKGGNGGEVTTTNTSSGGGGGGKGVVIFTEHAPATRFSAMNRQGAGGKNSSNGGTSAGPGAAAPMSITADPDGDGIFESLTTALPVELIFWKGNELNGQVQLEWATAMEENNHFFTIERSAEGLKWEHLAYTEGAGNSIERQYYNYMDEKPLSGKNYYRLSQTDYDGNTKMFNAVMVALDLYSTNLLLYPNPSNGFFKIKLPEEHQEARVQLAMYDAVGRMVQTNYRKELGVVVAETSGLSPGSYFLNVQVAHEQQNFKVIVR